MLHQIFLNSVIKQLLIAYALYFDIMQRYLILWCYVVWICRKKYPFRAYTDIKRQWALRLPGILRHCEVGFYSKSILLLLPFGRRSRSRFKFMECKACLRAGTSFTSLTFFGVGWWAGWVIRERNLIINRT